MAHHAGTASSGAGSPTRQLVEAFDTGETEYSPTSLDDLSGATSQIRGISYLNTGVLNQNASYLKYDTTSGAWALYDSNIVFLGLSTDLLDYPLVNRTTHVSPYGIDVRPANWIHGPSIGGSPSEQTVYLKAPSQGGRLFTAAARVSGANSVTELGTRAPARATFFEVGKDKVWWVDAEEPSIIYQSTVYGQNPIQLRYPVDTTKPIMPVRSTTLGLGEPFVMYHTTGVATGIVIAYLNEDRDRVNQCAR